MKEIVAFKRAMLLKQQIAYVFGRIQCSLVTLNPVGNYKKIHY
jgi:hypothetical protein